MEIPDETGGRLLRDGQFPSLYWWASHAKADRVQLALFAIFQAQKRRIENPYQKIPSLVSTLRVPFPVLLPVPDEIAKNPFPYPKLWRACAGRRSQSRGCDATKQQESSTAESSRNLKKKIAMDPKVGLISSCLRLRVSWKATKSKVTNGLIVFHRNPRWWTPQYRGVRKGADHCRR